MPLILGHALDRRTRPPSSIIVCFMAGGALAFLYFLTPALGPLQAFGTGFPDALPPAPIAYLTTQTVDPALLRSALPSLHMLWAMLMVMQALLYYPLSAKIGYCLFGIATIIATLGLGEHYLIDLIISIPLTLAVFATCLRIPLKHRLPSIIMGSLMGLTWLFAVTRHAQQFSPKTAYASVIASIAITLWFGKKLAQKAR